MTRSQLVFGLAFVVLGVLLLLDEADRVSAWSVLAEWWPTVVILAGLAQLFTRPRNVVGGLLLALLGGTLLLWTLGAVASVTLLWPVLLIALGLWLLLGRVGYSAYRGGDAVELTAVFDDRSESPTGPFPGGNITSVFADVRMDLRRTVLDPSGATLHVTTVFGDIDLDIPDGWQVTVAGPELFGDVMLERATEPPTDAPTLRLRVLTVFGDITVRTSTPAPAPDPTSAVGT